jgi:hypothetical protein
MSLDSVEKVARLVLWLAISSACLIAPITYLRLEGAAAEMKEAAKKADAEEAATKAQVERDELSDKKRRFPLASMGTFLTSLTASQGQIVFTNVSPRSGMLCVYGVARNRTSGKSTASLPACKAITPYESTASLSMLFAGGEMVEICPNSSCDLDVKDAPEAQEIALAAAASPKGPGWAPPPTAKP